MFQALSRRPNQIDIDEDTGWGYVQIFKRCLKETGHKRTDINASVPLNVLPDFLQGSRILPFGENAIRSSFDPFKISFECILRSGKSGEGIANIKLPVRGFRQYRKLRTTAPFIAATFNN